MRRTAFFAALALAAMPGLAQDPGDRTERVQFARGASSATVRGTLRGYGSVNYIIRVTAGQVLSVQEHCSRGSCYFNVWAPGGDEAIFQGAEDGYAWRGVLEASGDYRIQIYLYRNEARRNRRADYSLRIGVSG